MINHLAQPAWLLLIPLVFLLWVLKHRRLKKLPVPNFSELKELAPKSAIIGYLPTAFRLTLLCLLAFSLARPQSGKSEVKSRSEGLDIVLVLDTSGSMKAMDFAFKGKRKDRMFVIKQVVMDFISKRRDDRIGTVIFGTEAFPHAPMTLDHDVLLQFIDAIEIGMAGESTAIGDAIAVGANRLKDLKSKSKIMILLTDGSSNAGKIDPLEAAKAAATKDIKIYTIGVGAKGLVPIPTPMGMQQVRVDLDEKLLAEVSRLTKGQYFRAYDTESLVTVYDTIDRLEKTTIEVQQFFQYEEKFAFFVGAALLLLLGEMLFGLSRRYRLP